ncbi:MAG: SDR family NAD(P)-dependent oxidoreductase [Saprospiraceae bacterium]|nr:SDR family NAD(P)-dependent oxidoreductase [Saprospiraceae bacterium]
MSSSKNNPQSKTILVTGATSGIGKATARYFAKKGYNVIITGRRKDKLEEIKKTMENKYGSPILAMCFDVCDFEEAQAALNSLTDGWEKIDILVNNAGGARGMDPIQGGQLEHWNYMIDTNIKGVLHMARLIAPQMAERGKGHIINICSTAGHEVYPNGAVYCASKHAVDALTKGMRHDLFRMGVRVSQISPGMVEDTEFAINRFEGDEERAKIYEDITPLNARDVAELIFFVATRPRHVNIQDILVMSTQQASSTNVDRTGRKYE